MSQKRVLTTRVGSYGTGRPDALLVAGLAQLGLEVGALQRGVEAFLDAGGEFGLHVVRALLLKYLGVRCGLSEG